MTFDISQLLKGLLAALDNNAVYEALNASETHRNNAWYMAFFEFYDRFDGAARDYEMPVGKKRIKNFKVKIVDEIWPLLDKLAKKKCKEIVKDDTKDPDEFDEIPLDKHLKSAIEQLATYNAIKASKEEAVALAKEENARLKMTMRKAEEEYSAIPRGVEGRPSNQSTLTLHPHCNEQEVDEDCDDESEDDENYDSEDSVPPTTSNHAKKRIKKHNKKPPTAGDANLSRNPFEDVDQCQDKVLSRMKRLKEDLFQGGGGDDNEENKLEKRLKLLYKSEDHHRKMGRVERADQVQEEISKIEKDVLGI
jgi:hypothetical protein